MSLPRRINSTSFTSTAYFNIKQLHVSFAVIFCDVVISPLLEQQASSILFFVLFISSSFWVAKRFLQCHFCLSRQPHPCSLPSAFAMLLKMITGLERIQWEERRLRRCQNSLCAPLSHSLFMQFTFSSKESRKGNGDPGSCLFYTLPLKGKYSLGLARKWRGWEEWGEGRNE